MADVSEIYAIGPKIKPRMPIQHLTGRPSLCGGDWWMTMGTQAVLPVIITRGLGSR